MQPIEVQINPGSAEHQRLETQLRENLSALKTIKFSTRTKPLPAGTLTPGAEQVVAFVIEHYDKLIPLTTAVITLITKILGRRPKPEARKTDTAEPKPVIIIFGKDRLSMPSSQEAQKRFLKRLQPSAFPSPASRQTPKRNKSKKK